MAHSPPAFGWGVVSFMGWEARRKGVEMTTEQMYQEVLAALEMDLATEPLWGGTVDGKFVSVVCPTDDPTRGRFTVRNMETGDNLIDESVTLEDPADSLAAMKQVQSWMLRTIEVVDAWYAEHGETPPE